MPITTILLICFFQAHGHGIDVLGDNKNLKDQDGNILKLKEENSSLVKKVAGKLSNIPKMFPAQM